MQLKKEVISEKESTKKIIKSKVKKEILPKKEIVLPENTVILKEILSQSKYITSVLEVSLKELLLQSKEVNTLLTVLKERFI